MNLKNFFTEEKIEYFAVLDYSSLPKANPKIAEREKLVPQSAVIYLVPYFTRHGENISSYAVSRDYHIYIKELNERLIAHLSAELPQAQFKGYGDHSPLNERLAAAMGGLGVIGKNGLLINEKYGSYVFIGEVLTDAAPQILGASRITEISSCMGCGACLAACPTGALITGSGCLSDVTQRKGELSENELELMRKCNTVWGCDICQQVCPHNLAPISTPISFFRESVLTSLTESALNSMSDEEFKARAYSWRGRKTVERNLKNKKC